MSFKAGVTRDQTNKRQKGIKSFVKLEDKKFLSEQIVLDCPTETVFSLYLYDFTLSIHRLGCQTMWPKELCLGS